MNKRLFAAALTATALASVAAIPAHAAKDELVIGIIQFPSNMNPNSEPVTSRTYALNMAYRNLTAFDDTWKNTCLVCETLPSLENGLAKVVDRPDGKKGMQVTVKLHPKVTWGDGTPMTTKDLVFTWNLARKREAGFAAFEAYDRIEKIDVIDDKTAVLHYPTIRSDFAEMAQLRAMPAHIEGPIVEKVGAAEYMKNSAYNQTPTNPGLYNGPYRISDYQSGSSITFEPNPHWFGQKPHFKRVTVRTIQNSAALLQNLLSGDIDYSPGEGIGISFDQVAELEKAKNPKFTYVYKPGLTHEHIDLQPNNPILQDKRVREALIYAINRKQISERLFQGKSPVANSFVGPLSPFYTDDVKKYDYDPARAKALLDQAGWKPGPDGIRRNAKGEKLSLEYATTSGNSQRELVQQVFQTQWKDAGIEVVIKNEPARSLFGETARKRTYTGMMMYAWANAVTEPPGRILHTRAIPTEANNFAGSNFVAFSNPDMDAAIDATLTELDAGKRMQLWATMQKVYVDNLPVIPLFFRADAYAFPAWLKGVKPTGHEDYSTNWVETWTASN